MKNYKSFLLSSSLIFILVNACGVKTQIPEGFELILDGIYVESYDSTNAKNQYTADNEIYKAGAVHEFEYHFINRNGDTLFYKKLEDKNIPYQKRWKFVDKDSVDEETITGYKLTVEKGAGEMFGVEKDYTQSVIEYRPVLNHRTQGGSYSSTGLIENSKNIWMHPNRSALFRITQLNPWPFIQKPYKVGNRYSWSLKTGSSWGDERWLTWEKTVETKYQYEIIGETSVKIGSKKYPCLEIKGEGTSKLGKTYSTTYFNKTVGFLKIEYTNIDSSKLIIELKEILSKGGGRSI